MFDYPFSSLTQNIPSRNWRGCVLWYSPLFWLWWSLRLLRRGKNHLADIYSDVWTLNRGIDLRTKLVTPKPMKQEISVCLIKRKEKKNSLRPIWGKVLIDFELKCYLQEGLDSFWSEPSSFRSTLWSEVRVECPKLIDSDPLNNATLDLAVSVGLSVPPPIGPSVRSIFQLPYVFSIALYVIVRYKRKILWYCSSVLA